MEIIVITLLCLVFVIIHIYASESKKETRKERYGEAIGLFAQNTADTIKNVAYNVTLSEKNRQKEIIRKKLIRLYGYEHYSDREYMDKLLTVDDNLKRALNVISMSEKEWNKLALSVLYVGVIRNLSRDSFDNSKKITKQIREYMANQWAKDSVLKSYIEMLDNALIYFKVSIEDWVNYGDAVIEMYNLNDFPEMEKYEI